MWNIRSSVSFIQHWKSYWLLKHLCSTFSDRGDSLPWFDVVNKFCSSFLTCPFLMTQRRPVHRTSVKDKNEKEGQRSPSPTPARPRLWRRTQTPRLSFTVRNDSVSPWVIPHEKCMCVSVMFSDWMGSLTDGTFASSVPPTPPPINSGTQSVPFLSLSLLFYPLELVPKSLQCLPLLAPSSPLWALLQQ